MDHLSTVAEADGVALNQRLRELVEKVHFIAAAAFVERVTLICYAIGRGQHRRTVGGREGQREYASRSRGGRKVHGRSYQADWLLECCAPLLRKLTPSRTSSCANEHAIATCLSASFTGLPHYPMDY
jgi:hypothetical protein